MGFRRRRILSRERALSVPLRISILRLSSAAVALHPHLISSASSTPLHSILTPGEKLRTPLATRRQHLLCSVARFCRAAVDPTAVVVCESFIRFAVTATKKINVYVNGHKTSTNSHLSLFE